MHRNVRFTNDIKIDSINYPVSHTLKYPESHLFFKETALPRVQAMELGTDGVAYVVDDSGLISKYENIASGNPELIESGIIWDRQNLGRVAAIKTTAEGGLLVFANRELEETAVIYKMASINSAPELKYEAEYDENGRSFWSLRNGFGIKTHHNGFATIILAGVYGRGQTQKDLLLSTDNGDTFNVIKKTSNVDQSGDYASHWHDVAIDWYHGMLWASEGDGDVNHNVYYSDDMGLSWNAITPVNSTQPTALIPFPDKVIMGRDSGLPGLDLIKKPFLDEEYKNPYSYEAVKDFKTNIPSHMYYAQTPVHAGKEAYVSFVVLDKEPRMILGSGDWGSSWHFVFMSYGDSLDGGSISGLVGMDDKYIYAFGDTTGGSSPVWFSEKTKWS